MVEVVFDSVQEGAISVGQGHPLLVIAGPCALESAELAWEIASEMKAVCQRLGVSFVFKASYDKANRTSLASYRGPGIENGLRLLARLREELDVPIISDIHDVSQAELAAEVLDIIQIPAFLCRQTDLLAAAAKTGKVVNIKKGQFVSPWDMKNAVDKVRGSGGSKILLTERGATFGYNNLVVDMRSIPVMRSFGCPVVFDATHSVQLPGGGGTSSGGQRQFIGPLTRAAVGAGLDGIFMEVHPRPEKALCDGPNSLPLDQVEPFLQTIVKLHNTVQEELS